MWVLVLTLMLIATNALAGTVTFDFGDPGTEQVTTNAATDAYLNRLRIANNGLRASAVPPLSALNLEQYVRSLLVEKVQDLKRNADESEKTDFCTAFNAASTANKNSVIAIGGNNTPCP